MSSSYRPPPPSPSGHGYAQPAPLLGAPGAPPRKNRTWVIVIAVVAGILVLVVLSVGGLLAVIFAAMRSSEPYQHAVEVIDRDPRAAAVLGAPVTTGWFFSGNIDVSGGGGNADLAIPVSGSRHKGTIEVVAKKSAGRWTYQTLELKVDGQDTPINLLAQSDSESQER
jgi:Cytochrome oxidase complex assembly protein 1